MVINVTLNGDRWSQFSDANIQKKMVGTIMGRCNRLEIHTIIFLPAIIASSFILCLVEGHFHFGWRQ
jgi:hypothetical protein